MTWLKERLRNHRHAHRDHRAIAVALRNAPTASMRRELIEIANYEKDAYHLR